MTTRVSVCGPCYVSVCGLGVCVCVTACVWSVCVQVSATVTLVE